MSNQSNGSREKYDQKTFTDLSSSRKTPSHEHLSTQIDDRSFNEVMQKHCISGFFSRKLKSLIAFKIVFILDDLNRNSQCSQSGRL